MSKKQDKTNVMRILEQKKVEYNSFNFDILHLRKAGNFHAKSQYNLFPWN